MLVTDPPVATPSLFVRRVLKPMTRILNPVIRKVAGRKHVAMAAQIHHVGRHSGRPYVTPASGRPAGEQFLIPLTFGTESDWCRNVRAAGGCIIRFKGTYYTLVDPEVIDVDSALPAARTAFKRRERIMFRAIGITHLLRLRIAVN